MAFACRQFSNKMADAAAWSRIVSALALLSAIVAAAVIAHSVTVDPKTYNNTCYNQATHMSHKTRVAVTTVVIALVLTAFAFVHGALTTAKKFYMQDIHPCLAILPSLLIVALAAYVLAVSYCSLQKPYWATYVVVFAVIASAASFLCFYK